MELHQSNSFFLENEISSKSSILTVWKKIKEDPTNFMSPHYFQSFKSQVGISNMIQKELFVQITILVTKWFDSHFLTECANGPIPFSFITSLIVSFSS